jgi:hypothetical protein
MCNSAIIEPDNKELQYRRIIMQSIECALKRGDQVFEKFTSKEQKIPRTSTFKEFKESLKDINHEKLK